MGILFHTSFDHYTTILQRFSTAGGFGMTVAIDAGTGRNSTDCLKMFGDGVYTIAANITQSATIYGAFAWKTDTIPSSGRKDMIASIADSGTTQCYLALNPSGILELHRGTYSQSLGSGTVVATATNAPLLANTWYHIEWKLTVNNTTGACQIWLNQVSVMNATGLNTRSTANNYGNQFCIAKGQQSGSPNVTMRWDDLVVRDDAQSGDVQVKCFLPTGVGATDQWTASAGTTAQCVDEAAPNDDTDYISEDTVDEVSVFDFDDLPSSASIVAVCPLSRAEKTDAGTATYKHAVRSGGTVYTPGTEFSPSNGSYAYFSDILTTDPDTSLAWTYSGWSAAQIGVKRIT